jgi:hypothetical protein
MAIIANKSIGFWQLPDDIKRHIFEYDDTYRNIMKNDVSIDLWRNAWIRERNSIDSDYFGLVYDYLFHMWGVYEDPSVHCESTTRHYARNCLPGNYKLVMDFDRPIYQQMGLSVRVENKLDNTCIFDGWILTESEHRDTSWLDTRVIDYLNVEDVHWDIGMGLYLWQRQGTYV